MIFAIIAAAGNGTRLDNKKKQFIKLKNKTILEMSVEKFVSQNIHNIVIATHPDCVLKTTNILAGFKQHIKIINGGKTRMESIKLAFLENNATYNNDDIILIHDAARPFFEPKKMEELIYSAKKYGAATLAAPCFDSVKYTENEKILKTIDRSKIYFTQTPQAFKVNLYRKALNANKKQKKYCNDDCELLENIGVSPKIVVSSPLNLKITTKDDLKFAEFIMEKTL